MSLSSNVSALAVRVAEEFNTVRSELAGKLDQPQAAGLPGQVLTPDGWEFLGTRSSTSAANIDADAVDMLDLTLNENETLTLPSGGYSGKAIQVYAEASGGDRTLTFSSSYQRLDGIESSYVIPEGKILRAALRRVNSTWIVEAVGVTQ